MKTETEDQNSRRDKNKNLEGEEGEAGKAKEGEKDVHKYSPYF